MNPPIHVPFPWLPQAKITGLFRMEETLKIKSSTGQPQVASEPMQCGSHTHRIHTGMHCQLWR